MKAFLCGGGSGEQTAAARGRLNEVIDHRKPCLYIPLAMEEELYDSCLVWIRGELADVEIPGIEMVRSAGELAEKELSGYSFLFFGGGNTFKLLKELKDSGAYGKIGAYLRDGGVVFGGSAGAIIFGKDLEACRQEDPNEVGLTEVSGYDLLGGVSLLCHYTSRTPEEDAASRSYLLELSKERKAAALPEEVTLYVTEDGVEVLGDRPFFVFDKTVETERRQWL